jgi:hypothetical protein
MTTIRKSGSKYFCMSDGKKPRSWLKLTQEQVKRKTVNLQSLFSTEFVTLIKKGLFKKFALRYRQHRDFQRIKLLEC